MTRKPKKITVKFFLNRMVDPVGGDGGKQYYPLYLQVTYNRKNMQFRSSYGLYYEDLDEVPADLMAFEERVIQKIVRREAGDSEDYGLRGLKHRFEVYSTSIERAVEGYIRPRLSKAIQQTNSELLPVIDLKPSATKVKVLLQAALRLFDHFEMLLDEQLRADLKAYDTYQMLLPIHQFEFDFPTLTDWQDGSYQTTLNRELKKVTRTKKQQEEVLRLIRESVEATLLRL